MAPLNMRSGIICLVFYSLFSWSCESGKIPDNLDGESLARTHCASCHQFPEPGLLNKEVWVTRTLPVMGERLGIFEEGVRDSLVAPFLHHQLDPGRIFPEKPLISAGEWEAITGHYRQNAPERLPAANLRTRKLRTKEGIPGFTVKAPALSFSPPMTTMVQVQENYQAFFVANYASESTLVLLDRDGQLQFQFEFPGAPVATRIEGQNLYILVIGSTLAPTVASEGAVYVIRDPSAGPEKLVGDLKRPVDLELADLNGDGKSDLLICEYGHYDGRLSWYEQQESGVYRRHVLKEGPGAINAELHDFDGDGKVDIGVLMAQGDEGFDIYYNVSAGVFEPKRVLRFPPVYGSTSFSLADFNADGILDILYTNGDNADSSPVLKEYHGIRVFQSLEAARFEEVLFIPLDGAFSAQADDFDGDGDLDIAAISYFPDYEQGPENSFVLLTNDGNMSFSPYTFERSERGRWLVMDVGDVDGDSDRDILLGSNIGFGPKGDQSGLYQRWEEEAISYLILENGHK